MAWYDLGTVKVTVNSSAVTGTGTKWLAGARQGEAFVAPDGRLYEVLNIASDTSLTLTKPYRGATATGQPYALAPMQGYVKELADRAAELVPVLAEMGTAAKATLATSTQDPAPGRVMRNGDWGFGGSAGVDGDKTILSNPINGIYRSGSADVDKPDGANSGSSYFKFGWGGTYYGLLYASPMRDAFYMRTVNNAKANAWKELMTVGRSGLGTYGAMAGIDVFPGSDLAALNIGAGMYYYTSTIGDGSEIPFPAGTGNREGVVLHRQSGSAGAQLIVSNSGRLGWRGRRSGTYGAFKEGLAAGDYGLGGAQANPPNTRAGVNPSGWYYGTGATTWGGGQFFLDFPYGTTSMNAGFRISTDPYSDRFYMNGAVSGKKEYRPACQLVHDKNIVGDVGSGSVIATGYNANGKWVRFADGTQICFSPVLTSSWIDLQSGNAWVSKINTWVFPVAFLNADNYVINGNPQDSKESIWLTTGTSRSAASCSYKLNASFRWDVGLTARLVALGRWKA
ncbi:hypothetical protein [Alcaligenes faecalis]|uniref:hypothetical protein n=1 Tax=Alcaligenes faecalis TaxID=511 RepID=UPI00209C2E52|nr:hypothetical protein [Alcaligenes faecalis]